MIITKSKRLKVSAETKYLAQIRDFATRCGHKFGFNLRQLNGYKLSVDEICTNIIHYSYNGMDTNGGIEIEIKRQENRVVTKIIDRGVDFDYNSVKTPDLNEFVRDKKRGGFGIFLVKSLNDDVYYDRVHDRNIVTIVNNVKPRPSLFQIIKQNFKSP